MKDNTVFRVEYDYQPDDAVYACLDALKEFGLKIIELEGRDGWQDYQIVKIDTNEQG